MTITQIECFIEAARAGSFSKAGANLFISQATISRQIKALENDLGFPLFERKNVGVSLTEMGMILFLTWEELLIMHRTAVDKARDFYDDSQKQIRIGVQDLCNFKDEIREAIFRFLKMSTGLDVDYEILPSNKLLHGLESGELHIIITYTSELINNPELKTIIIEKLQQQTGIVLSKYHRLAHKKKLEIRELKEERFGILGSGLSIDYKERIRNSLRAENMLEYLRFQEYNSWPKLEFDLITGKCVSILYGSYLSGLEDKLEFFPLKIGRADTEKVAIAWKDDKYLVKAKNIADMF